MGLSLIVHADDFGLSETVNDGIRYAYLNGILTSTSIMPTGKAFSDAVSLLRSLPDLDIGIHLTLVEERPLLPPDRIDTLVDNNGHLHPHARIFIRKHLQGRIDSHQIQAEFDAQIRKVMDTSLRVTHIDTHQHLHALPSVLKIVISLAQKYGIKRIRKPTERLKGNMFHEFSAFPRLVQMLVLNTFCRAGNWKDILHTDHFAGFFYGGRLSINNLRVLINSLPNQGTCELMCHPGAADESHKYAHWDYNWSDELGALIHNDIAQLIHENAIRLISYRDL